MDDRLMAARVRLDAKKQTVDVGATRPLFATRVDGAAHPINSPWQYFVAPDGRFLMRIVTDELNTSPITVILNWKPTQ